jgi:nitrate reductase (NAD(P)H)
MAKIMKTEGDKTEVSVIDANKTEKDILLRHAFHSLERDSNGQLTVTHVLSHPSENWKGLKGHVDADIIREHTFEPSATRRRRIYLDSKGGVCRG